MSANVACGLNHVRLDVLFLAECRGSPPLCHILTKASVFCAHRVDKEIDSEILSIKITPAYGKFNQYRKMRNEHNLARTCLG